MEDISALIHNPIEHDEASALRIVDGADLPTESGLGLWLIEDTSHISGLRAGREVGKSPFSALTAPPGPEVADGAIVTMVRNGARTIGDWLNYYHALGFRRVVLVDHGSIDGTALAARSAGEQLEGFHLIVVEEANPEYRQRELTTGAAQLALSRWSSVEWILALDCDEFLVLDQPLGAVSRLTESDARQIRFPLLDQQSAHAIRHARRQLLGDATTRYEPSWVDAFENTWPTLIYKVALTRSALREHGFAQGNHHAEGPGLLSCQSGLSAGAAIRHAPSPTSESHLRKARSAVAAGYANADSYRRGGDHWVQLATLLQEKGEDAVRSQWIEHAESRLARSLDEAPEVRASISAAMLTRDLRTK